MTAPLDPMAEAVREVQYAIASLPLPWGAAELNAPLARVSDALAVLRDTATLARPSDTMASTCPMCYHALDRCSHCDAADDTRRVDWLDKQGRKESGSYGYTDPRHVWTVYGRGEWAHNQKAPHGIENHAPHDNIRAAIDAAINAGAGQ